MHADGRGLLAHIVYTIFAGDVNFMSILSLPEQCPATFHRNFQRHGSRPTLRTANTLHFVSNICLLLYTFIFHDIKNFTTGIIKTVCKYRIYDGCIINGSQVPYCQSNFRFACHVAVHESYYEGQ